MILYLVISFCKKKNYLTSLYWANVLLLDLLRASGNLCFFNLYFPYNLKGDRGGVLGL